MKLVELKNAYRIGKYTPLYDISNDGMDCSKWGLTDLYENCEADLRELLESGMDFQTTSCDCRKEPLTTSYARYEGELHVSATEFLDDLWEQDDLICDALYAIGKEDIELSDEDIEYIRDICAELDLEDYASVTISLPTDTTYEQLMDAVEKLENELHKEAEKIFDQVKSVVADCIATGDIARGN